MKLLQNPIAVSVLAGLALILVFKNVVWPTIKPRGSSQPAAKLQPAPAKAAPVRSKPKSMPVKASVSEESAPVLITPVADIDHSEVAQASLRWTAAPRRDPFNLDDDGNDKSARELLTLSAVWRQTSSTLAVINNRVLAEGETILEFRIEAIENHGVWVQGPGGREYVEFKVPGPPKPESENPLPEQGAPGNVVAQKQKR